MDPSANLNPDLITPLFFTEAEEDARRREARPRTLLGGKLVFGPQDLTADCSIRNLTVRGAKIQTSVAAALTKDLWLIVIRRGVVYRAAVAWRRDEDVGLRFQSQHDLATDSDPRLKIVRHVWRQLTDR